MKLNGFAAFGLEDVHFVSIACDGHARFFPSHDATLEVHDAKASRGELVGCVYRAPSTTAIDGNTLASVKFFLGGLDEGTRFDIHVQGALEVAFGKFFTCSDVHELDIGIVGILGKRFHVGVLECLLAACRGDVDAKHGQ